VKIQRTLAGHLKLAGRPNAARGPRVGQHWFSAINNIDAVCLHNLAKCQDRKCLISMIVKFELMLDDWP